jgi:hypothetical protein
MYSPLNIHIESPYRGSFWKIKKIALSIEMG